MRKTKVTMGEADFEIEAYVEDGRWNGFLCPWFTQENADKLMAAMNALPDSWGRTRYDDALEAYVAKRDQEEDEFFKGEMVEADGKLQWLFPIGNHAWVWEEALPTFEMFVDGESHGVVMLDAAANAIEHLGEGDGGTISDADAAEMLALKVGERLTPPEEEGKHLIEFVRLS